MATTRQTKPASPANPALRARYEERRQEVVAGAARVFAERGYERTSVQQLAARLDLATGALYHYFPGKEALLIAICDELTEPLLQEAQTLLAEPTEPKERLRALLRLWVGHVLGHREHLLVFTQVRHLVDHGEQWRGVRRSRKAFEQLLAETLAAADPPGDPRLLLSALLGMVNHTVQWYRPRGRLRPEQIADGYAELVLGSGSSRR